MGAIMGWWCGRAGVGSAGQVVLRQGMHAHSLALLAWSSTYMKCRLSERFTTISAAAWPDRSAVTVIPDPAIHSSAVGCCRNSAGAPRSSTAVTVASLERRRRRQPPPADADGAAARPPRLRLRAMGVDEVQGR